ncbi:MAG: GTP pyrophosphokinase family protein [Oscillospiraceae bacterium]|nr:GTP pyrophosphokinase family protein [Oscillospiraceae bacterium]
MINRNETPLHGLLTHIGSKGVQSLQERTLPYRELMSYYRCAMMEVETKFNVLNEELNLKYDRNPIESIKTRLKSPESILEKLNRKGLPLTLSSIEENLFDIAGVRVICSHPSDIYRLADALSAQDDIRVIERKDYIAHPKPNGYRSLHLIVEIPIFLHDQKRLMKVEVQFRTISMDWWASLEHKIRYKKDLPEMEFIEKELFECASISADLDRRMEELQRISSQIRDAEDAYFTAE